MKLYFIAMLVSFVTVGCYKPPEEDDTQFIDGYVIGRESCYQDGSLNYWLIDCTVRARWQTPQIGDSLIIDSVQYSNVIKLKSLPSELGIIGMPIAIGYTAVKERSISVGCNITSPTVYYLREIVPTMIGRSGN